MYTTLEENDVFANDDVFVGIAGSASAYLLHLFKKTNDNREDSFDIRAVVKSTLAPTSSPVLLQIWNGTTLSWETIATNATEDADTKFSLDAMVPVNESNYYDFGNQVAVRVYQLNNSIASQTLSIDQFKLSFIAQYEAQFVATGNQYAPMYQSENTNYTEVFAPVTTDYSVKYPHENPQDDL